ncbi:hypothetical protein AA313_de0204634 [Arthrobotrys entomopaga]|nr:hypothetical protein AA313_de0204634 [Arthrobotrys entomopaga]
MGWRSGTSATVVALLAACTGFRGTTFAAELVERQTIGGSNLFSGQFCDYTSFQASLVGSRILMFGGNLTINKGPRNKEKRELEPGFQFFSLLLNQTFSTTANVGSFVTREPDPVAEKDIASMRDGGAYSYNGDIYFYGGQQLFNAGDDDTIYKCTPTSENIVWNSATLNGANVNRAVTKGASLNAPSENKGFYYGGQSLIPKGADSSQADLVLNDTFTNNMVVVTFSGDGQRFTNITASPNKAKPLAQSNLLFVPAGKEGILINLGGDDGTGNGAWDILQVFDIASSTWFNQQTRGNLTSGRSKSPGSGTCSVIVSDGDNQYIYVYGGSGRAPGQSQLAILSVPAFEWFTVENSNFPSKVNAQCQLSGERQMIILGGRSSNGVNDCGGNSFVEILDLSTLEIVTSFPDNSPFTPPSIVTTASNMTSPANGWTDPELQELYKIQYQTLATRSQGSKLNTGAIIGGVVGGVAGVILIGVAAVYFIMKRHRKKSAKDVKEAVIEANRNSAALQPFLTQPSPGFPSSGFPSPGYPQGDPTEYPAAYAHYKDEYYEAPANEIPAELAPQTPPAHPMELSS